MNIAFTQQLRNLAKSTKLRDVKNKIDAYFTIHGDIDITDAAKAQFLIESLSPFKNKDQGVYSFIVAFENRKALNDLGVTKALMEIKKSKLYGANDQIKDRVDQLIAMKSAGGRQSNDIRIFEAYQQEVQGLVLDDFFKKYMTDAKAKVDQYKAYEYVDTALELLSKEPNPELLDNVFSKLESSMSLPANQVPMYLIKSLSAETHLSPIIGNLLTQLKTIDPMTQRMSMNRVRYVGNAGVYESVVAPVAFGKDHDIMMIGNRLFKVSEKECIECVEGDKIDAKFVGVCEAFAQSNISESGSIAVSDRFNNTVEIDENNEGKMQLTINKSQMIAVNDGWQQELLASSIEPRAVTLVGHLMENMDSIVSLDNVMSITSAGGAGYSMHFIKQGNANHVIINDPASGGVAIQNNIPVREAVELAKMTFGVDVSKFFEEKGEGEEEQVEENKEIDGMKEIDEELNQIQEAIGEISKCADDVQKEPEMVAHKKNLEKRGEELAMRKEELMNKAAVAN